METRHPLRHIHNELDRLTTQKRLRWIERSKGVNLSSNDYLLLSRHPYIIRSVRRALKRGVPIGAGGSRLLGGTHDEHIRCEEAAAKFFGTEKSLLFTSGFLANYSVFSTLPTRRGAVILDERAHASIKEGVRASLAKKMTAVHNDLVSFESCLKRARKLGVQDLWVGVESLYSMDGDFAPIPELLELVKKYDAQLIVDEAHAVGIFGESGRGLLPTEALKDGIAICVAPCGKALGSQGAIVAAASAVLDYLVNSSRPFIYTTAISPVLAVAIRKALTLIDIEPWRREELKKRARTFCELAESELSRITLTENSSQILPVIVGGDEVTVQMANRLCESGFYLRAVRPPTVPEGQSRLRISLNAGITNKNISRLISELSSLEKEFCQ